jgi:hypothetical protein
VSRRTPLAVAVVGALLIGGATTGTTHALWRDEATVPGSSVASGTMSHAVTVDDSTPFETVSLVPGQSPTVIDATIADTSPPAKNLRQAVKFTGVELVGQDTGLSLSQLTMSAGTRTSNGCSAATPAAADGDLSAALGTTSPGDSIHVCLRIAAVTGTTASGTLQLTFAGEQVRPGGQPAGWTSVSTASVGLTVTSGPAVPPALVLRCDSDKGTRIVWDARATSFNVYESESLAFGSEPITTTTSNQYTRDPFPHDTNATRYFKVRSTSNGVESPDSNIIKMRRNGASVNVSCGAP